MADLRRWKTESVPGFTQWMVEPSDRSVAWLVGAGNSIWCRSMQTPYPWPVTAGPLCPRTVPTDSMEGPPIHSGGTRRSTVLSGP